MKKRIAIIHGPNLNLLGRREPELYGDVTLSDIDSRLRKLAKECGVILRISQSNSEGEIVDLIQKAAGCADGIVLNPGAYSHYSWAIYDAVKACGLPVVEVHITNIHAREEFRRRSVIAPACVGQISGFGWRSYLLGIQALIEGQEAPGSPNRT